MAYDITRGISTLTPMSPFEIIAGITTVLIVLLAVIAKAPTYHAAPWFLVPAVWALYFLRRRVYLHPIHYVMFCAAVLLHMLGAFGFYQRSPLPFSYDILVHFYFAFAVTFMVHQFIASRFALNRWPVRIGTLMFMMGCGALHEIMEYMTYLTLGEEKGMLKTTSYFFDTQRDLTNNLLGTITALVIIIMIELTYRAPQGTLRSSRFLSLHL